MDEEEDEVPTCPLCLEELDATDRAVNACQCGYQVCLWCLHHIREQLSARCPACRTPYEEQNFKFSEVNPEQAAKEAKERATAKKERERREKREEVERERARAALVSQQKAKNNLKHVRILQRNLVYVIGLSLTLAREEVIRRTDMFGKFGRMVRVLVNRAHPFNADAPGGPSISAYVQYYRDSDASAAARGMNSAVLDGREIRCAIATTKYCDVFVRSAAALDPNATHHCGNALCMYYHSIAQPENVLSREEVLSRQLGPPPPAHLFLVDPRRTPVQPVPYHRPGVPPPGTLPISAPMNANMPATSSALPGPRVVTNRVTGLPVGSGAMSSSAVHGSNHVAAPSGGHLGNTNIPSSIAIPSISSATHTNTVIGQQPMSSSPHARGFSTMGGTRRPVVQQRAASPTGSPQRTPPSSPGIRRALPRLHRSPGRDDNTTAVGSIGAAALPGGTIGVTTATAAPYFSPPANSTQLPSVAGWGVSPARSKSRSPPRRSPSSSFDDPSKMRPRVQLRRRENAPPGFEDAVPSRPPGFDMPDPNHIQSKQLRTEMSKSTSSIPPISTGPPGFGPSPAASKGSIGEDTSPSDVAAAWAQEASTDEVFQMGERRAMRPVGEPPGRTTQEEKKPTDSRTDLAQVLAKIGGDLGVSSEFHNIKSGPPSFSGPVVTGPGKASGIMNTTGSQPTVSSLFGAQSYQGDFGPLSTTNSAVPVERNNPPQSPTYAARNSGVSSLFGMPGASTMRTDVRPARRNNSRFNFARSNEADHSSRSMLPSVSLPQQSVVGMMIEGKLANKVAKNSDMFPGTNGMPTESHIINEMSRNPGNAPTPVQIVPQVVPQVTRQTRSRYDFADHGSSPTKTSSLNLNMGEPHGQAQAQVNTENDPVGTAFAETFANLTTAEKLASIFSSAEWAAEQLPPMPNNDHDVKLVTGQLADMSTGTQSGKNAVSLAVSSSDPPRNVEDHLITSGVNPQSVQFGPPGFREAAPGTSPESTAVDRVLTSTGVATSVASGGIQRSTESSTHSSVEESHSSGTESVEDDRKRSRAQRKRDKKSRHLKEAAEQKTGEAERSQTGPTVPQLAVVEDQRETSHDSESGSGLVSLKRESLEEVLGKPEEVLKQLMPNKLTDDPGRFMSVSELEREVEAARAREAQLQDRLLELQRRIRSYDNVRT